MLHDYWRARYDINGKRTLKVIFAILIYAAVLCMFDTYDAITYTVITDLNQYRTVKSTVTQY